MKNWSKIKYEVIYYNYIDWQRNLIKIVVKYPFVSYTCTYSVLFLFLFVQGCGIIFFSKSNWLIGSSSRLEKIAKFCFFLIFMLFSKIETSKYLFLAPSINLFYTWLLEKNDFFGLKFWKYIIFSVLLIFKKINFKGRCKKRLSFLSQIALFLWIELWLLQVFQIQQIFQV